MSGLEMSGVISSLIICTVNPCERVASVNFKSCSDAVVDGEVECIYAGTSVGIGVFVGVSVGSGVDVVVPLELLADGGVDHIVCAVIDGEVECVHTGAAVSIGVFVGVCV